MTTFISELFTDTAGHSLDGHSVPVGGPWVPMSGATGKLVFTNSPAGTRLKAADATAAYSYTATSPATGDGQIDISATFYNVDGGAVNVGGTAGDAIGVRLGVTANGTGPGYSIGYNKGPVAWRINYQNADGTQTKVVDTTDVHWTTGANNVTINFWNNNGHPRIIIKNSTFAIVDFTDTNVSWSSLAGKYLGVFVSSAGSGGADNKGYQYTGTFTATDHKAITLPIATLPVNTSNYALTVTGSNTNWVNGTTPIGISGGHNASIVSQNVVNPSRVDIVINTGDQGGTLTFTDVNSLTTTLAVQPAATAVLLSGPSTGAQLAASTVFTLTLDPPNSYLPNTATFTPSDGGDGGAFSPTTIAITPPGQTVTFTYTPAYQGVKTITVANNAGLTAPAPIAYTVTAPPASALTLTGPSLGPSGQASTNFTAALYPVGSTMASVVVTPNDGGLGGTFSPTTVTLSTGTQSATFTYTPSSPGAKPIGLTNNQTLGNPISLSFSSLGPATDIGLVGPSVSVATEASDIFTASLLPAFSSVVSPVTVTPNDGAGGGTFQPTSFQLSTGTPSVNFTYTAATSGTKTINLTNNGGLSPPIAFNINVLPVAIALTLSGPNTGTVGVPTSIFTVGFSPGGSGFDAPVTVTPNDNNAGGFYTPASTVLSTANPTATFVYTPAGPGSVTTDVSNDGGLAAPASWVTVVSRPTATDLRLQGPTSGTPDEDSETFLVTTLPFGSGPTTSVIVTPSDSSAGGTFSPATVTLTSGSPSATFVYHPSATPGRDVTIVLTNNGGLSNPTYPTFRVLAADEWVLNVNAYYGPAFTGLAGTMAVAVDGPTGALKAPTYGLVYELASTPGSYNASVVLKSSWSGTVTATQPTGADYPTQVSFNKQKPRLPVLSSGDTQAIIAADRAAPVTQTIGPSSRGTKDQLYSSMHAYLLGKRRNVDAHTEEIYSPFDDTQVVATVDYEPSIAAPSTSTVTVS